MTDTWLAALACLTTLLHDGHGEPALRGSPAHYVAEPVHAWPILVAAGLLAVAAVLVVRRRRARAGRS